MWGESVQRDDADVTEEVSSLMEASGLCVTVSERLSSAAFPQVTNQYGPEPVGAAGLCRSAASGQ